MRAAQIVTQLHPGEMLDEAALRFYMQPAVSLSASERSELVSILMRVVELVLSGRPALLTRVKTEASKHLLRVQLASAPIFRELEDKSLWQLAVNSEFVAVKRGEIVIQQGSEADCLYVVVRGSLEVFQQGPDTMRSIAVLGNGASIGEMAVLLNEPRTASVRARRDSILIRISGTCFDQVLHENAAVALRLARTLSEHLKRTTASPQYNAPVKAIALVRWCDQPRFEIFCERFVRALRGAGYSVALETNDQSRGDSRKDVNHPALSQEGGAAWLASKEAEFDYVLCPCGDAPGSDRIVRQTDLALFVGIPGRGEPAKEYGLAVEAAQKAGVRPELVLLGEAAVLPSGTSKWLDLGPFQAHHHVVLDDGGSYQRVARRISGTAWGLVLGGGGARGLAHIGVIRAMVEGGFPIDMIGGTSMGAIIAAQYAMGCKADEMLELTRRVYTGSSGPFDLTMPFVSMRTGGGTIARLRSMFGNRQIEDLPIGYFCVSCNLTRAETVVHDRGPLWMWTRVSCSVPGLLPPVPYRGDVLVDGALLDNLPVDAMRKRMGGYVAASDVSVAVDLGVDSGLDPGTPWSGSLQILRKMTHRPRLPNLVDVLMRTAEISSVRDAKSASSPADLYLHPPVDKISMTDFQAIDKIVAIGYEYTMRQLEERKREFA